MSTPKLSALPSVGRPQPGIRNRAARYRPSSASRTAPKKRLQPLCTDHSPVLLALSVNLLANLLGQHGRVRQGADEVDQVPDRVGVRFNRWLRVFVARKQTLRERGHGRRRYAGTDAIVQVDG